MTDIQETWVEKMATKHTTNEQERDAYMQGVYDAARVICGKLESMQSESCGDNWYAWAVISELLEFIEIKTGVDTEQYVVIGE